MVAVRLLVGTRKGLFVLESDEAREDWTVRGPALEGWAVANTLVDPRVDSRTLAVVGHFVYGPTVHRSSDRGETWTQVEASPAFDGADDRDLDQVWTVAPGARTEPDVLYAGVAEAALFRSADGGEIWTEVVGLQRHESREEWFPGKGGLCVHSIVVHPADPDRIWLGISAVGVLRTDDRGETWEIVNDGLGTIEEAAAGDSDAGSCVHRLVGDPDHPDRLFQQNHLGVYRSRNGGDEWEALDDGLPSTFGFPMAMHPRDPDTLYVLPLESGEVRMVPDGEPAVYRTRDTGDAWERMDRGLPTDSWVTVLRHAMAVDDGDPVGVYVGTTGGDLYHSADEGDSWAELPVTLPRVLGLEAVTVA